MRPAKAEVSFGEIHITYIITVNRAMYTLHNDVQLKHLQILLFSEENTCTVNCVQLNLPVVSGIWSYTKMWSLLCHERQTGPAHSQDRCSPGRGSLKLAGLASFTVLRQHDKTLSKNGNMVGLFEFMMLHLFHVFNQCSFTTLPSMTTLHPEDPCSVTYSLSYRLINTSKLEHTNTSCLRFSKKPCYM